MRRLIRPEFVLVVLWPLVLLSLILPSDAFLDGLAAMLILYLLLSVTSIRWQVWALCGVLAACTVSLASVYGVWDVLIDGVKRSLIVAAFLPTINLLRATAEHRPEIMKARQLFGAQDAKAQGRSVLVGSHVLGAVLIVGIFALLAPIMGDDTEERDRRRLVGASLRGMCLAVLWSPFFFGVGLANEFLPDVELVEIMPLGLICAVMGLLVSHMMFDRAGGVWGLFRSLVSFASVLPAVAVAAVLVLVLTAATELSTLQALVVGMPVLCLTVLLAMGRPIAMTAVKRTRDGLGRLGNELAIVTFAMMLGSVVQAVNQSGAFSMLSDLLRLAPWALIGVSLFIISAGGLAGLHPIVTVSILLALLGGIETGLSDLILMQTMLFGWAFSTMISVSGVALTTASAMFAIPPERLVRGENLIFVVVFGTISVFILAVVNYFLAI